MALTLSLTSLVSESLRSSSVCTTTEGGEAEGNVAGSVRVAAVEVAPFSTPLWAAATLRSAPLTPDGVLFTSNVEGKRGGGGGGGICVFTCASEEGEEEEVLDGVNRRGGGGGGGGEGPGEVFGRGYDAGPEEDTDAGIGGGGGFWGRIEGVTGSMLWREVDKGSVLLLLTGAGSEAVSVR
eukprot:1361603-Pyramimonas_sp.AAC.1